MSITSLSFLLFLTGLLILFFAIPKKWQWGILLIASLAFYLFCGVVSMVYILATSVSVYFATVQMQKLTEHRKNYLKVNKAELSKEEKKAYKKQNNRKRRILMILCLILNFGFLAVFKYSHFLIAQINTVIGALGLGQLNNSFSLLVPLGISYYTLQATGYLIDVFWENVRAEKNFFKVLLFVSFFPQITQGPISAYEDLSGELFKEHSFNYDHFSRGFQRMLWGFFKKMAIADILSPYVSEIFSNFSSYTGITCLFGGVLYMFQLYADFSGYMDIMCGYCEMLGIRLTENFRRPFFSKSISEFWRRWHISLGAWLRKYVYYPVAVSGWNQRLALRFGKRLGEFPGRQIPSTVALLFVWISIGLWHDASWAYIAWGMGNAFFIILSLWLEPVYAKIKAGLHIRETAFPYRLFQVIRTFFLLTMLEAVAAVENMSQRGGAYISRIFSEHTIPRGISDLLPNAAGNGNFASINLALATGGLVLMLLVSLLQRKMPVRNYFARIPFALRIMIMAVAVILIAAFGVEASWGAGAFMYANF